MKDEQKSPIDPQNSGLSNGEKTHIQQHGGSRKATNLWKNGILNMENIGYLSGGIIHSSAFLLSNLYLYCSCGGETSIYNDSTCLNSTRNPSVTVSSRSFATFGYGHERGFHVEFCRYKSPVFLRQIHMLLVVKPTFLFI